MTYSARTAINLHATWPAVEGRPQAKITPQLRQAFEERAARMMCKAHDPFDILKAWEDRSNPDLKAQWEMYVAVTKARMVGHFDAEVIRDARIELG